MEWSSYLALLEGLRSRTFGRILVVCDDDNVGSARVIESCAAVLEAVVTPEEGGAPLRRYWID
jgi:predicted acetyltransferase